MRQTGIGPFLSMNAAHSVPRAFLCAAYRFPPSPGPRSTAEGGQRCRMEVKNEEGK